MAPQRHKHCDILQLYILLLFIIDFTNILKAMNF